MNLLNRTVLLMALLVLSGEVLLAAPTVKLGVRVSLDQQIPAQEIDHASWHRLLQKYVNLKGLVDYRSWKSQPEDLRALKNYLNHLSAAQFTKQTPKNVKLAFWINAYNAVTVQGILREYPTTSIRNHTARVFGYNIWNDLQLIVGDNSYSLDHMEHKILHPLGEPRIHFAVVCASIGCPRLLNQAYVPEKLDQQLDTNGKNFFANRDNLRWDNQKKTIAISKIIEWYGKDFGKSGSEQLKKLAPLFPSDVQSLARSGSARISYLSYDWNLNDQSPPK